MIINKTVDIAEQVYQSKTLNVFYSLKINFQTLQ